MEMKKIPLTKNACNLIKFTLSYNGEKEINVQGKEADSARRLNAIESAQRRHFMKIVNPVIEEMQKQLQEKLEEINKIRKEAKEATDKAGDKSDKTEKKEKKHEKVAEKEIKAKTEELNEWYRGALKEEIEVEISFEAWKIAKKYFNEFGDKHGFQDGDDEAVEEIGDKLQDIEVEKVEKDKKTE